jgi:zona occludens toxin
MCLPLFFLRVVTVEGGQLITLITGVPGSGKTLYALNLIKLESEKGNSPGTLVKRRKVYYSGIRDLTLPWELFGEEKDSERPWETDPEAWYMLPIGAIIVIDECQRLFRPRSTGGVVPRTVKELETHRHRGYDIFLITQHPLLIDSNIRRLVGRHYHVIRRFGGHRAVISEWSACTEISKGSLGESIRHQFRYPKEAFTWYKSAEVHTHKRRIPMRIFFLWGVPLVLVGLGFGVWKAIGAYATGSIVTTKMDALTKDNVSKGGVAGTGTSAPGAMKGITQMTKGEWLDQYAPRVSDLAYTAPVYDGVTQVTRAPVPVACVASVARCTCWSQDATVLLVMEASCRQFAQYGLFLPFDVDKGRNKSDGRSIGPGSVDAGAAPRGPPSGPVVASSQSATVGSVSASQSVSRGLGVAGGPLPSPGAAASKPW